ncbi:MAG: hypothetical protein CR963_00675 [Gammaproteobacteria bacterium]|nr:MAG: hypothetical protein CR963_00675 [Gammaproteobacteria bacterium]
MNHLQVTADKLPLPVREHLMRGQHDAAVSLLVNEYQQTEESAKQLIEEYRQNLRERKVALEIQVINEQQAKEAHDMHQLWWVWGVRIALVIASLALLYLMLRSLN